MERKKEGKISTRNPNPKSKKNNKLIEIPKNERTKNFERGTWNSKKNFQ